MRLGPGCGRLEGTALGVAGQTCRQGPGLRAPAGPQQQRLDDLGAAQPLLRHRQRASGEQAALDAQRAALRGGSLVSR